MEEMSHWAQRTEKAPSSSWSWWEFCHWLSGDGFTPTLSKGNASLLKDTWQPPQKNSSLLHHDRCWLNPKPVLSSMTEFLAWLCTCSCFICYSLMWGWHKAQWENLLTNVKWRSQDPRTLNSGRTRGVEANAKGNKDLLPAVKYLETKSND